MEFPDLGQHCSFKECNRLDFLPMKCSDCKDVFCSDHLAFAKHRCPEAHNRDVQVPVCPLCDRPIPVGRNEVPDIKVSQHIDSDCQSDPAKEKRKVYSNACSVRKCKKKELIKISCDTCKKNFCLTHRHPADHDCDGPKAARNRAAEAAMSRASATPSMQSKITSYFSGPFRTADPTPAPSAPVSRPSRPSRPQAAAALQGGLSEDEALARALQESMASSSSSTTQQEPSSQEEQDRMLALALQQSERDARGQQQRTNTAGGGDKSCSVS